MMKINDDKIIQKKTLTIKQKQNEEKHKNNMNRKKNNMHAFLFYLFIFFTKNNIKKYEVF